MLQRSFMVLVCSLGTFASFVSSFTLLLGIESLNLRTDAGAEIARYEL